MRSCLKTRADTASVLLVLMGRIKVLNRGSSPPHVLITLLSSSVVLVNSWTTFVDVFRDFSGIVAFSAVKHRTPQTVQGGLMFGSTLG